MQTQRDHVHAHQFMVGRISCALVEGDPSMAEVPGRRAMTGVLCGVIVAVLILAGFAVYGWIVPGGSKAYSKARTILVEKESGTRYVYLDGVLHPVPDLASAMLIEGAGSTVKLISRNSIKDVPHGMMVGLAGAPTTIPAVGDLAHGPWLVCLPGAGATVGINLDPAAPSTPLRADRYEVVRGPDSSRYVLTGDHRYKIASDAVLAALGGSTVTPVPAPQLWLDHVPQGASLTPADIPGRGDSGPEVGGRAYPVGSLFRQRGDAGQEFVLRRDGLAPLSRTEFVLLEADGSQVAEIDTAAVAGAKQSADRSLMSRLPDLAAAKWADPGDQVICLRQAPDSDKTVTGSLVLASRSAGAISNNRGYARGRSGSGMVVTPIPAPEKSYTAPPSVFLSDAGVAYALPDSDSQAALGLSGVAPVPFPRDLLATLRTGPALTSDGVTGIDGR